MEQRIDPNIWPEYAVGKDPAYIPGLVPPAGTAKDDVPEEAEDRTPGDAVPQDVLAEDDPESEPAPEEEGALGSEKAEAAEPAEEGAPVFEAADRRGSITADRKGIRFRLDDQEAEFWWDEIGAVEVKPARFGRRLTVTVHMSTRRWFDAEVEAENRARLKEWTSELDAVLDVYFEDT